MRYPAAEKPEIIRLVEQSHLSVRRTLAKGRVSEVVEIGWRRNLRVNQHPPNRRRQPPGRSRHEAEYR